MIKLIEVTTQLILILRLRLGKVLMICLEEGLRYTPKYSGYGKAGCWQQAIKHSGYDSDCMATHSASL